MSWLSDPFDLTLCADINTEPVPGSYAWKFPVLKEAIKFMLPFGSVSWQVNTSVAKS